MNRFFVAFVLILTSLAGVQAEPDILPVSEAQVFVDGSTDRITWSSTATPIGQVQVVAPDGATATYPFDGEYLLTDLNGRAADGTWTIFVGTAFGGRVSLEVAGKTISFGFCGVLSHTAVQLWNWHETAVDWVEPSTPGGNTGCLSTMLDDLPNESPEEDPEYARYYLEPGHVTDSDFDGYSNEDEAVAGSHPLRSQSRPDTDDDGDGWTNLEDASPPLFGCTGAYGYVAAPDYISCHVLAGEDYGYGTPSGMVEPWGGYELRPSASPYRDPQNRVWVWDSYCQAGAIGDYEACKGEYHPDTNPTGSNYDASTESYTGDFAGDGYGWRNMGHHSFLFDTEYEYLAPCGPIEDLDGDGVPGTAICEQTATVAPNGSVETETGDEVAPAPDPDDEDPNTPIPVPFVTNFTNTATNGFFDFLEDQINATTGLLLDVQTILQGLQDDLATLTNETPGQALDEALAIATAATQGLNEAQSAAQGLIADADDQSAATMACINQENDQYQTLVQNRFDQYLNDPTNENLDQLYSALTDGATAHLVDVQECANENQAIGQAIIDAYQQSLQGVVDAAGQVLISADNFTEYEFYITSLVQDARTIVDSGNDYVLETTQTTANYLTDLANNYPQFVNDLIEQLDPEDEAREALGLNPQPTTGTSTPNSDENTPESTETPGFSWEILLLVGAFFLLLLLLRRRRR